MSANIVYASEIVALDDYAENHPKMIEFCNRMNEKYGDYLGFASNRTDAEYEEFLDITDEIYAELDK